MESRREQLSREGKEIARQLGNGVGYYGPWLPFGPEGEFLGHLIQDDAVTIGSFTVMDIDDAREKLVELRKNFGAEPPVF